jgi:hypothetical protein
VSTVEVAGQDRGALVRFGQGLALVGGVGAQHAAGERHLLRDDACAIVPGEKKAHHHVVEEQRVERLDGRGDADDAPRSLEKRRRARGIEVVHWQRGDAFDRALQ